MEQQRISERDKTRKRDAGIADMRISQNDGVLESDIKNIISTILQLLEKQQINNDINMNNICNMLELLRHSYNILYDIEYTKRLQRSSCR